VIPTNFVERNEVFQLLVPYTYESFDNLGGI
jgi:hypothetical protein